MSRVDELITATLHDKAEKEVNGAELLRAARERGTKHHKRRRIALSASALSLVVAVAAGSYLWQSLDAAPELATGSAPSLTTALPPAPGEPAAAVDPARVGTDPVLLHFDVPAVTAGARHYTWTSGEGYERLWAGLGEEDSVDVSIGPDLGVLDGIPRQGMGATVIRQEPVPGLFLRVQASDEKLAQQVAEVVELDRSQRIVLPFQLGAVPDDAVPVRAYVGFIEESYAQGGVILRGPNGATLEVQAQHAPAGVGPKMPDKVVNERELYIYPGGDEVELIGVPHVYLSARIGTNNQSFDRVDAETILSSLVVAADLESVATWPTTPIPST